MSCLAVGRRETKVAYHLDLKTKKWSADCPRYGKIPREQCEGCLFHDRVCIGEDYSYEPAVYAVCTF